MNNIWKWIAIVSTGAFIFSLILNTEVNTNNKIVSETHEKTRMSLKEEVLPSGGIVLPINWGGLGKRMVEAGVIDKDKFKSIYSGKGKINEKELNLVYKSDNGQLEINEQNSKFLLNLFWALGLSNKNKILDEGPMQDLRYGGAGKFASTGGWTISDGNVMNHYSKHSFVKLTPKQQQMVERVSKGIYRPCCGNSTYFPDCNHGMAMLGLLELLASEGVNEKEIYKIALQVNSYWFPDTYLTIAQYLKNREVSWNEIDPKEILGSNYSSGQGYRQILSKMELIQQKTDGGGCGLPEPVQNTGGGCGL